LISDGYKELLPTYNELPREEKEETRDNFNFNFNSTVGTVIGQLIER
jgi:hypothetical protein